MNVETIALAVSLATFAGSVVSPIVVNLINNHHEMKKRKAERYDKRQCEVIENYLHAVGNFLYDEKRETSAEYGASYTGIYMYIPSKLWAAVDEIDDLVCQLQKNREYQVRSDIKQELRSKFLELSKALSAHISKR